MHEIDKTSVLPVYYQIAQQIRDYITKEGLKAGEMILSERELCAIFKVSRMTVRQAVDQLVAEGLLERQRGRGTFITTPKFSQTLSALTSFSTDTLTRGMIPTSKVLHCRLVKAGTKVAEMLQIDPEDQVVQVVRVRYADNEPHAYECSYVLAEMGRPLLDIDLTDRSLYQMLREKCALYLVRARELIEAKACPAEVGRHIQVPLQGITFYIRRVTYDKNGLAAEYVESHYRIDKFRFEVDLELQ